MAVLPLFQVDFSIPIGGPQFRPPPQGIQGQFNPVSSPSQPQGTFMYQPSRAYPMGQPTQPVYIVRAPANPMQGIPQYQRQQHEPQMRKKKIVQIRDPLSNKDVTQEILNRPPPAVTAGAPPEVRAEVPPEVVAEVPPEVAAEVTPEVAAKSPPGVREEAPEPIKPTEEEQPTKPECASQPIEEPKDLTLRSEVQEGSGTEKVNGHDGDSKKPAMAKASLDSQQPGVYIICKKSLLFV